MRHKRVAVLRGGPSEEYEVSMRSGAAVLAALDALEYPKKDIVITRKGEWLDAGFIKQPATALNDIDVVFIALHGSYGEDGQVQKLLQQHMIPYTGSGSLASALAFNKELTKLTLKDRGIKLPRHKRVHKNSLRRSANLSAQIIDELGTEVFIKPVASGSSHGARYVSGSTELEKAIVELLQTYEDLLVEEFIRGREATVAVMNNFRNERMYVLPAVEIVPPNGEPIFSYENKYNGKTEEICPGRFSYSEKAALSQAAALAHDALECKHYSRSDFIVRDGEVYFLEINTLPGLTNESLLPKAAASIGLSFDQLVQHLVETASV